MEKAAGKKSQKDYDKKKARFTEEQINMYGKRSPNGYRARITTGPTHPLDTTRPPTTQINSARQARNRLINPHPKACKTLRL